MRVEARYPVTAGTTQAPEGGYASGLACWDVTRTPSKLAPGPDTVTLPSRTALAAASLTRRSFCAAVVLILGAAAGHASGPTDTSGDALMDDGRLQAELEVRDAQAGFAGLSGTITRVERDGTFTVSRFLNESVDGPHRQGRLDQDEIESLAAMLAEQDFLGLPREAGQAPPVNARTITVTLGDRESTLSLEPVTELNEAVAAFEARPESPESRLLAIVQAVNELTADD
jgi:hypothetical protein